MKKTSERMASLLLAVITVMTAISLCFPVSAETTPYYYDSYITPSDYWDDSYQTRSNYVTAGDYAEHTYYVTESDYVYVTDPETGKTYITKSDYLVERKWTEIKDRYTGTDYSDESCYVTSADLLRESYRYDDLSEDIVSWHYNSSVYSDDIDITVTLNRRTGVLTVSGCGKTSIFNSDWYGYRYSVKEVIVQEGITDIGDDVFADLYNLKYVSLPDGLRGIGYNAFYCCNTLKSIIIPDSVEWIDHLAFNGCVDLKDIYYTGTEAQWESIRPSSIESSVTVHFNYNRNRGDYQTPSDYGETLSGNCGDNAVWKLTRDYNYRYILTVSGFGEIKTDWYMLSRLENYYIDKLIISEGITAIGDYAFYELNIFETELPDTLERIGDYAFYRAGLCNNLRLPESLEYIGKDAFRGTRIYSLEINRMYLDMHSVLYGAFSACKNLYEIRLGESITHIPEKAFLKCIGIEQVYYSPYLESIGDYAFAYCTTLRNSSNYYTEDYDYSQNKGSMYIGNGAFFCCYKLKNIYFCNELEYLGAEAFYKCFSFERIDLPHSLDRIENGTFAYCKSLKINSLPVCLKILGDYAFYGCELIDEIDTGLSLKSIGDYSFAYCVNLKNIDFPDTLETVYFSAFDFCDKLTDVYFSDNVLNFPYFSMQKSYITIHAPTYSNAHNFALNYGYNFESTGIATCGTGLGVAWNIGKDGSLTIGGNYDEIIGVSSYTAVPWHYYTDKITSLNIDEGIETIGANVFSRTVNLKSVSLPTTLKKIYAGAFADCRRLDNVILPDGVVEIGDRAFSNCSSLSQISVPDTVISVGNYAFYRCVKLSEIELNGAVYLGNYAFSKCTKLKNVKFGESLASVGEKTFENTAIRELYVPSNVSFIDFESFVGNDDITLLCRYNSYAVDFARENLINYLILGDISGDGELNAVDLAEIKALMLNGGAESSVLDVNRDGVFNLLDLIAVKKLISGQTPAAKPDCIKPKDVLKLNKDYAIIYKGEDGVYYAHMITFLKDIANEKAGTYYASFAGIYRLCENEGDFAGEYIYREYNPETDKYEIAVKKYYADSSLSFMGKKWWYSMDNSEYGYGGGYEYLLTDKEIIMYYEGGDIAMKLKPNADGTLAPVRVYDDSVIKGDILVPVDSDKSVWDNL